MLKVRFIVAGEIIVLLELLGVEFDREELLQDEAMALWIENTGGIRVWHVSAQNDSL